MAHSFSLLAPARGWNTEVSSPFILRFLQQPDSPKSKPSPATPPIESAGQSGGSYPPPSHSLSSPLLGCPVLDSVSSATPVPLRGRPWPAPALRAVGTVRGPARGRVQPSPHHRSCTCSEPFYKGHVLNGSMRLPSGARVLPRPGTPRSRAWGRPASLGWQPPGECPRLCPSFGRSVSRARPSSLPPG